MIVVGAVESGSIITITISVKEKETNWQQGSQSLIKLPRFQAMAKQLLTRADRDNKSYILTNVEYDLAQVNLVHYTFTWIKKNE